MRGDGFFRGVIRHGVGRGESGGLGFADGARGGGAVFEVEPEGVEEGGFRGAGGGLAGFGVESPRTAFSTARKGSACLETG